MSLLITLGVIGAAAALSGLYLLFSEISTVLVAYTTLFNEKVKNLIADYRAKKDAKKAAKDKADEIAKEVKKEEIQKDIEDIKLEV